MDSFTLVKEKMEVFVHLRIEKHGDEKVSAYDAHLSGDFSNSVLLKLHPDLRDTFYKAGEQGDVEDFKKELRFQHIAKPIQWDLKIPRTLLRMHDIDDPREDLVLGDGETDKFQFAMLEGGTVKLAFRVKLPDMTEEQVTKLLRANGQTMPVSLECAPLEDAPDNYEQADLLAQEPMSEARALAESQFAPSPLTPDDVVMAEQWATAPIDPAPKTKRAKKEAATAE